MRNIFTKILVLGIILSTQIVNASVEIIDCNSTQKEDLEKMVNYVNNNWSDFEHYLESTTNINLKSCIKNRFKKNGKIICEDSCGPRVNGWASYLSKKVHFCPSFMNRVGALSRKVDRRACYFALAVHEFGHTCFRGHGTVEDMDNAAFEWYERTHPRVTIDLINCGMD